MRSRKRKRKRKRVGGLRRRKMRTRTEEEEQEEEDEEEEDWGRVELRMFRTYNNWGGRRWLRRIRRRRRNKEEEYWRRWWLRRMRRTEGMRSKRKRRLGARRIEEEVELKEDWGEGGWRGGGLGMGRMKRKMIEAQDKRTEEDWRGRRGWGWGEGGGLRIIHTRTEEEKK